MDGSGGGLLVVMLFGWLVVSSFAKLPARILILKPTTTIPLAGLSGAAMLAFGLWLLLGWLGWPVFGLVFAIAIFLAMVRGDRIETPARIVIERGGWAASKGRLTAIFVLAFLGLIVLATA